MAENEQFSFHGDLRKEIAELRKELEGKIKDEVNTMRWFLGLLVVILIAVLGYFSLQQCSQSTKIDDLMRRVTILETKFESRPINPR